MCNFKQRQDTYVDRRQKMTYCSKIQLEKVLPTYMLMCLSVFVVSTHVHMWQWRVHIENIPSKFVKLVQNKLKVKLDG